MKLPTGYESVNENFVTYISEKFLSSLWYDCDVLMPELSSGSPF